MTDTQRREQAADSSAPTTFSISVVIPTYNRADALLICLDHLERQSWRDFEVIVVDDGSTDATSTRMRAYLEKSPLSIRYVRQENSGPARARNVAIAMARSPVCLMLGDDIFATQDLVRTHYEWHIAVPDIRCAAVGLTLWSETGQIVTPFMRWLDQTGGQFAYGDLLAGMQPVWSHFYTSNLSVKTELLSRNPFNESFTKAMMEDMELGYRLEVKHGLRITFLQHAVAHHLHPTSFERACTRACGVGGASVLFHHLWPQQRPAREHSFRSILKRAIYTTPWLLTAMRWFTSLLTKVWCPNPLIGPTLVLHFRSGYHQVQQSRESRQTVERSAKPQLEGDPRAPQDAGPERATL